MSARLFYTSITPHEPIEELGLVMLSRPVSVPDDGRTLPVGTSGTVVGVLDDGVAYVVEFTEPFAALLDLAAEDVAAVPGESRADLTARCLARRVPGWDDSPTAKRLAG